MQTEQAANSYDQDEEAGGRRGGQDPYLAFALRWWWLVLIGVIVGAAGGLLYVQRGPFPYQSIAQVQVPPQTTTGPTGQAVAVRDATLNYTAEATTSQMFTLVSQELGDQVPLSPSDLALMQQSGDLVIRETKNTNFISITINDPNPKRAQLIANAFAIAFVRDVNDRASAHVDQRQDELTRQIDFTRQRLITAQLNQRAEDLRLRIGTQRNVLLQLQTSYQEELQRQMEADRLTGIAGPATPELAATRARWLELISAQISDQEKVIRDLADQLTQVQAQLAQLPSSTDPSVSAAFATAYSNQLQILTQQFVQLQLDATTARTPLVRYGEASAPLPSTGRKKFLMMGVALGGLVAAGIGFAFDFLRQRRKTGQISGEVEDLPREEPQQLPESIVVGTVAELAPPDNAPDDLVIMIERARQRRNAHTNDAHPVADDAGTSEVAPRRPLPTQTMSIRRFGS